MDSHKGSSMPDPSQGEIQGAQGSHLADSYADYQPESHHQKSPVTLPEVSEVKNDKRPCTDSTACFVHSLIAGEWTKQPNGTSKASGPTKGDEYSSSNAYLTEDTLYAVGSGKGGNDNCDHPIPRSRNLTKEQLSDVAWNVHILSKKLSDVCIKPTIRSIAMVAKVKDRSIVPRVRELTQWLLSNDRKRPYIVYVENVFENDPDFAGDTITNQEPSAHGRLRYWNTQMVKEQPHLFDFVISLGGDGTVLHTNWLFQCIMPPTLSFSLGSLGFLTKFDFESYPDIISRVVEDGFVVNLRLRFECTVMRYKAYPGCPPTRDRDLVEELVDSRHRSLETHVPAKSFDILNDVVVDRGPNPTMSQIEVFGDNDHYTTLLADGVCVATPTGSTAYNLAAGGSLCHPDNPVILVTAIAPHTLSSRPIILPDTILLRLGVPYGARTGSWVSFDGRERAEINPGDYVSVTASQYPYASVSPLGRHSENWVHSISKALSWNTRQRPKKFE